jgi:hypothetical protein
MVALRVTSAIAQSWPEWSAPAAAIPPWEGGIAVIAGAVALGAAAVFALKTRN